MPEDMNEKQGKETAARPTPVGRMSLAEVDAALAICDKTVKMHSETVKAKLTGSGAIPGEVLRELSRANAQKNRLVMRRIALLVDLGDAAAMELLDRLMKLKPAKTV